MDKLIAPDSLIRYYAIAVLLFVFYLLLSTFDGQEVAFLLFVVALTLAFYFTT